VPQAGLVGRHAGQPEGVERQAALQAGQQPLAQAAGLLLVGHARPDQDGVGGLREVAHRVGGVGADGATTGLRQGADQRLGQRRGCEGRQRRDRGDLELPGTGPHGRLGGQQHRAQRLGAASDHQDRAARVLPTRRLGQLPVAQHLRRDERRIRRAARHRAPR
jgi:hypothetical protein